MGYLVISTAGLDIQAQNTPYSVQHTIAGADHASIWKGRGDNKLVPRWWSSYFVDMIVVTSAGGGREEEVAFTEYGGNLRWKDLLRV